jgi:hypothetical protein
MEAVANAFENVLLVQTTGSGYSRFPGNELVNPNDFGAAKYLYAHATRHIAATLTSGYILDKGWEMLWYHDQQAFLKFNTYIGGLPIPTFVEMREVIRKSLFENWSSYAYDGYPVEEWLNGLSFYSSLLDIPEGTQFMYWNGDYTNSTAFSHLMFDARVLRDKETQLVLFKL